MERNDTTHMVTRFWRTLAAWPGRLALAALLLLPALSACGGGGSTGAGAGLPGGTGTAADKGEVLVGLTDADGDFATYAVDVLSLTLTRADGTTVETLPATTRVDFAQYTSLTEFLTAATVPAGTYTDAVLKLDFSTADVEVEVGGVPVPAALQDAAGNPLGVVDVTVKLEGDRPLKVVPGLPCHLVLDFDLAASNTVDLTDPTAPLVTVQPILLADVNPAAPKPTRLRGLLKKVNPTAHLIQVRVLPFGFLHPPVLPAPLAKSDGPGPDHVDAFDDDHDGYGFGVFPVKTDADTAFEIDGVTYTGDDGLAALAAMPEGTPVVAVGDVNPAGRRMRATEVKAGTSVPWGDKDAVQGVVVARSGDVLTVRGAYLTWTDGVHAARDTVAVEVGPDTKVTRLDTDPATLDKDAISVGQRVTALGTLSGDMTSGYHLDATEGLVRMEVTTLSGEVVSVGPGTLVVNVAALDGRAASDFDFSGTGTDASNDADPANYQIETGTLALDFVTAGDHVQVRGFVTPFGSAHPDFTARTVVEPAVTIDGAALLDVNWDPATPTPFSASGADGVTVDLTGVGDRHQLIQRWRVTDLLALADAPKIVPAADGRGTYAISLPDSLHIYFTFAGFAEAVTGFAADGNAAERLVAHGDWSAAAGTLTSRAVALKMTPVTAPG